MWILIITILSGVLPSGDIFPSVTAKLESFRALKDCEDERIRITADMDAAYPPEQRNYTLECKPARRMQ